jgi:hypothetical protein
MNVHYQDYLRQWRLWLSFLTFETQIQMRLGQFPQTIYRVALVFPQGLHPREYDQL